MAAAMFPASCVVTGGDPAQRRRAARFLNLFLSDARYSASWLDGDDRALGPIADWQAPPEGAVKVMARRLMTVGPADPHTQAYTSQWLEKRFLSVSEFLDLADCWDAPLSRLSAKGREIARTAARGPMIGQTVSLPESLSYEMTAASRRLGYRYVSDFVAEAIVEKLARHPEAGAAG
jgi:hypothetical protein